ncbi:phosphatidic acid phosphatase [Salinigranum rubrum]|uniref:Phosphatidic acid phosphatase n=1 Tax=Salinigranum rubrum TaxID=755307 RepID=A0A2I8VNJ4_9EURY|nr:phosphatase PAP2 family protein [Salinigranum rubrum]AUV83510.1 phosphatidic acid phosphatase [Salinigranum rubrum]
MRGLGTLDAVSGLPPAVVDLFGLLTLLGDPWLLLGGLAALYAVSDRLGLDRRRVGFVLATAFLSLGVTLALKTAFALPRPPGAGIEGYGFPSGHALGATVVWVTAALALDAGRRRVRVAVAGVVVPVVAASRVVIGVHYLVDVVVGVAVGVALVGLVFWGLWRDRWKPPTHAAVDRVFALAAGAALVALFLSNGVDTLLTVGAALGGWVGWRAVEPAVEPPAPALPPRGTALAVAGLPPLLGGLLALDAAAEAATIPDTLTMGLAGGCIALLFALPRLVQRVVG